jgi:hypothetical protein
MPRALGAGHRTHQSAKAGETLLTQRTAWVRGYCEPLARSVGSRSNAMAESLDWERVDDIMVVKTRPGPITDARWNKYIADVETGTIRVVFALVWGSITVTATQRKSAAESLKKTGSSAIVLTDSRISRGILTAISWMGGSVKAWSWADLDKAVGDTGSSNTTRAELTRIARAFYDSVKETDAGD